MADNIIPERTLETSIGGKKYLWSAYPQEETGLRLITLEDRETEAKTSVMNAHPKVRVAAHQAWAGARYSRAPGTVEKIVREMGEKGIDPDAKLDETFSGFGHASIGDMARIIVYVDNVPSHLPLFMFHHGRTNSGQEKSTRYQAAFNRRPLHPLRHYLDADLSPGAKADIRLLEREYQGIGARMLAAIERLKEEVTGAYVAFYKPANDAEMNSLKSRVLDTTRFLLLLGQTTGFAYETSARDWSRRIAQLRGSAMPFYRDIGDQLHLLLAPPKVHSRQRDMHPDEKANLIELVLGYKADAPSLIKHADADTTVRDAIGRLRKYLTERTDILSACQKTMRFEGERPPAVLRIPDRYDEAERMAAQYILTAFPGMRHDEALEWAHALPTKDKDAANALSGIIFGPHDHRRVMPQLAETTTHSIIVQGTVGEARDLNRHRGFARYLQGWSPMWGAPVSYDDAFSLVSEGFGLPIYLTAIDGFKTLRSEFSSRLQEHYDDVYRFFAHAHQLLGNGVDNSFVMNLLPMAHRVNLWMHGSPMQSAYLTSLRTAEGGHINYRMAAFDAYELIKDSSPWLSGMHVNGSRPDPADREQFFSRK